MSVQFTSDKNYLKRHPSSGQTTVASPSTLNGSTFLYEKVITIPHSLGYVPMIRVYYEPYTNGAVWPATGSRVSGAGAGLAYGDIMCLWEVDSTNLTISLESVNSQTGSREVYWVIYWDN
jgi:hypothetical protein